MQYIFFHSCARCPRGNVQPCLLESNLLYLCEITASFTVDFSQTVLLRLLSLHLSDCFFCLNNREGTVFKNSLESLVKEIINSLESVPVDDIKLNPSEKPKAPVANAPKIEIKKKPGRAFQHKLTGKFLAESGTKSHFMRIDS